MIPRFLIIDTNVLVSGILSNNIDSPTARIVNAMLDGRIMHLLSPALLQEYREVLLRPKLRKLHGLSKAEVDQILSEITANAIWREPAESRSAPDPGDDHLWSLLQSTDAILVTGDQLLLDNPPRAASTILPKTCVTEFL
ncbi:MAG: putative toxin-antitoxin system toxin component, PIN family [Thiogranum sp.]